jgi:hypothetical protein
VIDSRTSRGPRYGARGLLAGLALLLVLPSTAGAQAEAERDDVRERRRAVDAEIDVLEATDAEIHAVLDDLDGAIAAQQRTLDDAEAAADDAERAVREADAELRSARRDVAVLERAIAEMAVASYMHPPTADLVQSLQAASFSDALLQQAYLDARAKRDVDLLDLLEAAEANAVTRAEAVEVASAEAERAVEAAAVALAGLRDEEARQLSFATDLQERIDSSLAEAAVLAELDAELAEQIAAEQAALIARIPPPPVEPVAEVPTVDVPAPLDEPTESPTPTVGASPPTTRPTTTRPAPTVTRPPSTVTPPLRTVRGITVHADIADDVAALVDAAEAAGIFLAGWGYRDTERQIELRIAHCGPTDYDIWVRPASSCSPPTAIPGRSLHEQGRAIDFTVDGRVITSRSTDAFQWLAEHAASYGLFNLPSEPWHWSTTGG